MDGAVAASTLSVFVQIILLDLLLSGDNAVVIALACRRLPPEKAHKAAWIGAAGAIFLRLALTLVTGALMTLPFLQLISALPLLVIALNLMAEQHEEAHLAYAPDGGMMAAAGLIVFSDAAMSLDNVMALGAVSGGSFWLLTFGLLLTIPLIVYGSFGFSRLMQAFPVLVDVGGALLGWVAGSMIAGDPLFAGYVAEQAPALGITLPLACALFVLVQGRWARAQASRAVPQATRLELERAPRPELEMQTPRAELEIQAPRVELAAQALRPVEMQALRPVEMQAPRSVEPQVERSAALEAPTAPPTAPLQASAPAASIAALAPAPIPALARAPEPSQPADDDVSNSDRWMLIGLLTLFVIFGLFLALTLIITE